ncbi:MAG: hypothetical protein RIT27_917 [Pseudomonadota bacterium]|jgi:release factor glutamine methyltransferase
MRISTILQHKPAELKQSSSPRLDVEVLLSFILRKNRSFLYAWDNYELNGVEIAQFEELFEQRQRGKPIAYLTGKREFWSMEFEVNENTLIPRPETELLVEVALNVLPKKATVWDLGTGSGCIALAIAKERSDCSVFGIDKSVSALEVARRNAQRLNISVKWVESDWFSNLRGLKAEMIISNPPYISKDDPHLKQGDVQFEPQSALISGEKGLDDILYLIDKSRNFLTMNGWLWIEHGFDQRACIKSLLNSRGYTNINTYDDANGQARVCGGQYNLSDKFHLLS